MAGLTKTPKVFGSSYQPPRPPRMGPMLGQRWRAIVIIVVVFGLILFIGRWPIFRLKTVELQGDSDPAISQGLTDLRGQPIFSRPVTSFIDVTRQNLTVATFNCRRGLPNALRCNLQLRTAALVWQSGDQSYLVDKNGFLYGAKTSDIPDVITVTDLSKLPVKLGSIVASAEIVNQYQQLVTSLKAQSLTVTSLQLNESLYQIVAIIDRPGHPPIQALFVLSGDVNNQVSAVTAALSQKGDSITAYVDARVPGYVYTK